MSEEHVISVTAVEGGWQVQCALTGGPLTFASDEQAQAKARALAICVAEMGLDACVVVNDASRNTSSTARYFADDPDGADALASAIMAACVARPEGTPAD